jgi:putative endonuclease
MAQHNTLGNQGEAFAAQHLIQQSFVILARNWRCEAGEADIVAQHEGAIVVVEVRTRSGPAAQENAIESITPSKQAKLTQVAYAAHSAWGDDSLGVRVDIMTVAATSHGLTVQHYPNALSEG